MLEFPAIIRLNGSEITGLDTIDDLCEALG
jgi:hypothetical protein